MKTNEHIFATTQGEDMGEPHFVFLKVHAMNTQLVDKIIETYLAENVQKTT